MSSDASDRAVIGAGVAEEPTDGSGGGGTAERPFVWTGQPGDFEGEPVAATATPSPASSGAVPPRFVSSQVIAAAAAKGLRASRLRVVPSATPERPVRKPKASSGPLKLDRDLYRSVAEYVLRHFTCRRIEHLQGTLIVFLAAQADGTVNRRDMTVDTIHNYVVEFLERSIAAMREPERANLKEKRLRKLGIKALNLLVQSIFTAIRSQSEAPISQRRAKEKPRRAGTPVGVRHNITLDNGRSLAAITHTRAKYIMRLWIPAVPHSREVAKRNRSRQRLSRERPNKIAA